MSEGPRVVLALCPIFTFTPDGGYEYGDIHERLRGLAEENGIEFVDLREAFDGRPGSEFSSDQLHPNTAGHALIAATLAERLVQYPK